MDVYFMYKDGQLSEKNRFSSLRQQYATENFNISKQRMRSYQHASYKLGASKYSMEFFADYVDSYYCSDASRKLLNYFPAGAEWFREIFLALLIILPFVLLLL
jgi:hypothetical protein